ncbi:MAG: type II secretion system F family protein [Syntrophomonadaceae bacterium]
MNIVVIALAAVALVSIIFVIMDKKGAGEQAEPGAPEKAPRELPGWIKNEQSEGLIDYSVYMMSTREKVIAIIVAALCIFVVAYIFYKNIYISLVMCLLSYFAPRFRRQQLLNKRKEQLTMQFKQALYSLGSSLSAGRSVENSFKAVVEDLRLLFSDPNTFIIREFQAINRRVENGEPIEVGLIDFGERADIEDIYNFVDVFVTCKRMGGNLADVIRRTSNIIGDKLQTQQDIAVMMAQKKFEARALMIAPVAMVGLMAWSSPDYMAPLYSLGIGPIIMTISLAAMGLVFWVVHRIMNIKV